MIGDRSRPALVEGFRFSCTYSFAGDPKLFEMCPSSRDSMPPDGDVVATGESSGQLTLSLDEAGEPDAAKLLDAISRELRSVEKCLNWQSAQVSEFNGRLRNQIRAGMERRLAAPPLQAASKQPTAKKSTAPSNSLHDLFISHAREDKEHFVRPLVAALRERGVNVWVDESEIKLGDSLRQKIDSGLAHSRFGLVVLSKAFFAKRWPQYELDGLVTREMQGGKVILPVWLDVSHDEVAAQSPSLAGKFAAIASDRTIQDIADEILAVLKEA